MRAPGTSQKDQTKNFKPNKLVEEYSHDDMITSVQGPPFCPETCLCFGVLKIVMNSGNLW